MVPHPGVDVGSIREKARKDLLDLLEGIHGTKNLVIERALAGPISTFCKASTLQQYGVEKFFFLENDNVDSSQRNVIFLSHGENAEHIIAIAGQIKRLQSNKGVGHDISVILVPRRTLVANRIFEDAGVLGDISIDEYPLYFVSLEQDLLSLELEESFKDIYLSKDPSSIFLAAKALMQMQQNHGLFPRILGKGDHAQRLMELLLRMRTEASADEPSTTGQLGLMPSADIESLVIIDREVDFFTVLLTQLTYEGFIDELYGIKDNQAEIDISIIGSGPGSQSQSDATTRAGGPKRQVKLDSSDKLYEQLRDANFARVGGILQQTARRMQTDFGGGKIDPKKPLGELKELVRKLPGYQEDQKSLKTHIGLADDIGKYTRTEGFRQDLEIQQNLTQGADPSTQHDAIEELIARGSPLTTVLRLLCLESVAGGGIRQKDLDHYRTLVMHAYGHQHLLTFDALERIGLLTSRTGGFSMSLPVGPNNVGSAQRTNYSYLRRALKLIVDEVNEVKPNDIAYVYSGYAPLSVRLVQAVVQKSQLYGQVNKGASGVNGVSNAVVGWQGFEDALKAVKGATFNKIQKGEEVASKARSILNGFGGKKTVVIMFLGGITRTEIAALRFLGQAEAGEKILICTTGMLTGGKMMDAAIEKRTLVQGSQD